MEQKQPHTSLTYLREQDFQKVQSILLGNAEHWDTLYNSAYKTVVRCAANADQFHLLGHCDYLDAADHAFALCFEQLDRYRGLSRFSYWVGGYARNIVRNRCSKELVRLRKQDMLYHRTAEKMNYCDPQLLIIRLERDACLWRAFFDLPVLDQWIIRALLFEEITLKILARSTVLTRKEILYRYETALVFLKMQFIHYYYCTAFAVKCKEQSL